MKKLKVLFVLLFMLFIIPVGVFAEEETTEKEKINVYFFHGDGCPHCEEASKFFDSIQEEYGKYFNLVKYEVWYDEDNSELMNQVAEYFGQEASGVPYIIIGNKTWNGYSSDYDQEIKNYIMDEYNKDVNKRYDVMEFIKTGKKAEKKENDFLPTFLILVGVAGVSLLIVYARKKSNK